MTGYGSDGPLKNRTKTNPSRQTVSEQNRECYQAQIQDVLFPNQNFTDVSVWIAKDPDDAKVAEGWYYKPEFISANYPLKGEGKNAKLKEALLSKKSIVESVLDNECERENVKRRGREKDIFLGKSLKVTCRNGCMHFKKVKRESCSCIL